MELKTIRTWNLSCKEATYLTALSEEGKLSFRMQLRLRFHLFICVSCRNFFRQTKRMAIKFSRLNKAVEAQQLFQLSSLEKDELKERLNKRDENN
jgi:hypothetical protein